MMDDEMLDLLTDDDDEYVTEEDIAEENGFYIDDDGNWIEMPPEMEEARREARAHEAWIKRLKKKYVNGKPVPVPKEKWPEIIAAWRNTDVAEKPWFHLRFWPEVGSNDENVQRLREALKRHHLEFDEQEDYCEDYEAVVDSPMGLILTSDDSEHDDEVLDTISIIDDTPYREGLPAPVYQRLQDELEEYSWIPQPRYYSDDEDADLVDESAAGDFVSDGEDLPF